MKIRLIWVGKIKEQFVSEGIKKYFKLLKPYADVSIVEIKEEKGKDIRNTVEKESKRILDLKFPFVLLDEKGKELSSVEFAEFISRHRPSVNFVVGGAFGVSENVEKTAKDCITLSSLTFTHEMTSLFLLEQIYRAFTIMHKKGYHH